jgi:hypothetical protein
MTNSELQPDPVFDPEHIGRSLDIVQRQFPVLPQQFKGTVIGDFVSRQKGDGFEPDGLRDYEHGDDMSRIDWPMTMQQADRWPQIRMRYQDVTPSLWVITDVLQQRNEFNPGHYSEQLLALSAVTAMLRMAQVMRMPSGVIAIDDGEVVVAQHQAKAGRRNMYGTAAELANTIINKSDKQPDTSLHLDDAIKLAARNVTRSVVAVVSDFRDVADPDDETHGWAKPIHRLADKGNQIIAVETTNAWDYDMPEQIDRLNGSTGKLRFGRDNKARQEYKKLSGAQQHAINDSLKKSGAHHITLSADDPRWKSSFLQQLRIPTARR